MKIKTIIISFLILFLSPLSTFAVDNLDIKSNIIPDKTNTIITTNETGTNVLDSIFAKIVDYTFGLLALIAVAIFIYIGYLFITSSGNEEQFKKAWKMTMYTVIGLAIISLSWGMVKLVTTLGL
nr:hypothetical protein [Candidatus Gracilibacteria bacterium]